jgi:hypothetical protein
MRSARSLLILVVLGLGLGAYIYFVEAERDLTAPEDRREKVFAVETGKIEEIEVRSAEGQTTTLRKNGDEWQIVAPVTAPADEYTVSSIVSTLETLEMQRVLEDNPTSVSQFGLEPVRLSVSFKVAGDSTPRRLNIGAKTPTGSDLYARVEGQPRLFLIAGYLEDTLNRSTFDLRDKSVLAFDRTAVDSIRIAPAGGAPVTLARKGADWRVTGPVDTRAESSAVDTLINRAAQATFKAVLAGEPGPASQAELRQFGLDRPQLVLELGAGSNRASLAIGGKIDDSSVYARDLSRPLVLSVDASLLTDFNKTVDDLRVKDVFVFKPYTAVGIEITRAGTTSAFEKSRPAGGDAAAADVWKQTKPEARDVNQTGMTDLLNTLSSLRAERFVPQPAGSGDDVVVVARSGDAAKPTEERVTLRRAGDVIHAIRPDERGAAVVPAGDFDKALNQLKELTGAK